MKEVWVWLMIHWILVYEKEKEIWSIYLALDQGFIMKLCLRFERILNPNRWINELPFLNVIGFDCDRWNRVLCSSFWIFRIKHTSYIQTEILKVQNLKQYNTNLRIVSELVWNPNLQLVTQLVRRNKYHK